MSLLKICQWGPWVATAFAILAATVQAISVAWEDRKLAKSDRVQKKRTSIKDIWIAIRTMLLDFRYWLVEGSLHEPLTPPKEFHEQDGGKHPARKHHRLFREVQFAGFHCDRCRNPASPIKYQCTDCDQGYCTNCWPRTQKRGAHLEDTGEQLLDPKNHSVQLDDLERPHSAASSSNVSPMQTPAENVQPQHTENGRFSFSPDTSRLYS